MKKILMILCLVVSTNLFAKTITDKTCDIYLIVDDHVMDIYTFNLGNSNL